VEKDGARVEVTLEPPALSDIDIHVRKALIDIASYAYDGDMDTSSTLDSDACYRALLARDARFDGHFFVGVSSTGIYCRPVCRVRTPKAANCTFFTTAASAEGYGYRPCLRCRPELAPARQALTSGANLARTAAILIDEGEADSVADLAQQIGVTDRHLRRLFEAEFGVTPVAYLQTQRLLFAKQLLTDTHLPVVDVAATAGFGSVRRLHELLTERYGLAPAHFRRAARQAAAPQLATPTLEFTLHIRPPYDWTAMLAFLSQRQVAGVEAITGEAYRRAIELPSRNGTWCRGIVQVERQSPHALRVRLSDALKPVAHGVLVRMRRLFDVAAEPAAINDALGDWVKAPGLRLPGAVDGFETAVRVILGQQVTVRAATTLAGRLAQRFGMPLATESRQATPLASDAITHTFPRPDALVAASLDSIGALGIIRSRVQAIVAVARALTSGALSLQPGRDPEQTLAALMALPGVGPWTAQLIVMRALAWPDQFLAGDLVVRQALGGVSERTALAMAERWRPYRSYAVLHLWHNAANRDTR
jgi:AraC family transcriptional regulator, regulatory protein of adaptative response / DNA-3-methyladenine glycosylase II